MRRMLVSRISRRVLAEHHIALSKDLQSKRDGDNSHRDHVGIIFTNLSIKNSIDRCAKYLRSRAFDADYDLTEATNTTAAWSEIIVDGHTDTTFPYIPEHLEYVIRFVNP
jgi:pyruvate dehydrogenase kinase 2/3/4